MKASSTIPSAGVFPLSNRRQPIRQTRTNPSRASTNVAGAFGDRASHQGGLETGQHSNTAPGFFPAITHFTNSISALPKEIIRHFTLLKEVDAKVFGPEETLTQLVAAAANAPAPPPEQVALPSDSEHTNGNTNITVTGATHPVSTASGGIASGHGTQAQAGNDDADLARRSLFYNLRVVASEMLMTLDEKNHVLSTATEALNKQLARVDSSFPHIDNEISEEARYGSLMHWAYADKSAARGNGTTAGERSRRDVAAANNLAAAAAAVHEGETAVSRSESRREAMLARKQRHLHAESDFDDGRQSHPNTTGGALRKPQGASKVRKPVDAPVTTNGTSLGLGITNGTANIASSVPNKRRRTEKPVTSTAGNGIPVMERAMSSVMQNSGGAGRGGAASPRETPAADVSKKRARGVAAPSGPVRKRNNTNTSAAGPPSLVSSPVVGTPTLPKESHRSSPVPSIAQRPPSSRARQNSTQTALPDSRQRAQSSASNKQTIANGSTASAPDTSNTTSSTVQNIPEVPKVAKEDGNPAAEHAVQEKKEPGPHDGNKTLDKPLKREDTDTGPASKAHERTTSIQTITRKASKTSTPITATFPEPPQRSRPSRTTDTTTAKRSHKKGAGAAAQQLIAAATATAAADDEGSSMQGDDEDDDGDDSEPRYCYCNQVSYGEMVACDMDGCPREWFHLDCVGLLKAPTKNAKWYCDECKENLRKGRSSGGSR